MDLLQAKSIHIFAFPFFLNDKKSEKTFKNEIIKAGWEEINPDWRKCVNNKELLMEYYMLEQYLSNSAENIYMNEQTKACRIYKNPLFSTDEFKYVIKKDDKCYELDVHAIELHVYDYGVGILFFKLLNMDESLSVNDIKKINDYGRRISMPFLPAGKNGFTLCADSLGIKSNRCSLVTNYRENSNLLYEKESQKCTKSNKEIINELLHPAKFIENVLNGNFYDNKSNTINIVTATDILKKDTIPVMTMTDDRMFVMTLIRDEELSLKLSKQDTRGKEKFKDKLYSVIFIDNDDATCQNEVMRNELLDKAVYARWENWGTLFAATGYSFVCITTNNAGVNSSVVRPFYLEYIYFVSLVLAQRLSIIKFSFDTEILAKKMIFNRGFHRLIPKSVSYKLVDLQERYVSFVNRMLILECSCQEQGVEMYRLLQKQLMVDEEKKILDEQLHSMYEAVNTSNGTQMGWWGLVWACASVVLAIAAML